MRLVPAPRPFKTLLSTLALTAAVSATAGGGAGCESDAKPTTRPMSFRERQDQALRDPMNYKPDFSNDRISTGDINDFDKEGFKRDLRNVLNP